MIKNAKKKGSVKKGIRKQRRFIYLLGGGGSGAHLGASKRSHFAGIQTK